MSAAALAAVPQRLPLRVRLGRVLASEWVKARSVPSTPVALGTFVGIMLTVGLAITLTTDADALAPAERAAFDPVVQSLSGVFMGQVALGVLGALLVSAEHASRTIVGTVAAVPSRLLVLLGKALLVAVLVLPVALVGTAAATAAGLSVLDGEGLGAPLTDPSVLRAVAGGAVYLTLVAVLGLAVGALLRSTAAAVVVLTLLLFLLPVLVGLLPAGVAEAVGPWLPSQAGQAALALEPAPGGRTPLAGLAVLAGWVVVALAAAAASFRRRDV